MSLPAPYRLRCAVALLLFHALFAFADPPGRVGRVAWLSGPVYLHRAASGQASAALLNWPITTGDVLSTGSGARAEVQIGAAQLQLDAGSVLEFVQVDDRAIRLQLLDGSVIARLASRESAREFELATRDGRFRVRDAGRYRFDSDRSNTAATVFSGGLRFDAGDLSLDLGAGQRARFWNAGGTRYQLVAPVSDDFAAWSWTREQQYGAASQAPYVSAEMTGAVDLDAYGYWSDSPEYGAVWFPRAVTADWAPYRTGRWVWVEPWGWTWVGDEPWGFAPFHYGRWVLYGGAWGWVPGRWVARPVYAPALVAWVGRPPAAGSAWVGARPSIGWFPLAPREVYIPPYRSSADHVRQVNGTQVARLDNASDIASNPLAVAERTRYVHQQLQQAVTTVPSDVMTQGRRVRESAPAYPERMPPGRQAVPPQAPMAPAYGDGTRRPDGRLEAGPAYREGAPTLPGNPSRQVPATLPMAPAAPARPAAAPAPAAPAVMAPAPPVSALVPRPATASGQAPAGPAGDAARSVPSSRAERPEQHVLPAPAPLPPAAAPSFQRSPVEVARPATVPGSERPEQRPQVTALPPPSVPRLLPVPPASTAVPAAAPAPSRPPGIDEQRRQERAVVREEPTRQQWRPETRAPVVVPQPMSAAPGRTDAPGRPERSAGPEHPQESGRRREQRADPHDGGRPPDRP
ncbi:MAG TPA: hypothetical protein PLO14_04155 [Accumulibacter sp.]|nr:hypothetical protein [Accumulibacter sp.]